ncbi:3-phosphoglycerate dehydrogenase [Sulfodiicoccus acidiphilus]|uniref:3-phosphoglycerate dehydrogenase n=1 Tax=Sulfodiicoccus acidiphilus TaxID=1670455 RepID=A0A348B6B3_9CREN|nr:2-hydroxyacid dehydrogenase [Sulfodiicoccus acidiphilus]BBD73715.1 3-phosphoglycerate dehydrogenase [Sulfodiicoccus acidiphilus]GGT97828.1 3-phosphoglycerate dehydrogenase [Sulfodiicoccus acidiphilus]
MKIVSTLRLPEQCMQLLKGNQIIEGDLSEVSDADVLMGWPNELSSIVRSSSKLKAIQTFSAGVEALDFRAVPESVKVFSNAGAYAVPVAEHAWALVLALAKRVGRKDRGESYVVTGKTLLVLGAGGIGSEVARIGKAAFSMITIGISRSFKRPEFFDERYPYTEVDNHLGRADVIVNALPLTRQTEGFLNWERLSKVKEKSIIVNVGRGETVERDALVRLLMERPTVRFGTDVFWRKDGEENFQDPLWEAENFTGTPHTAGGYANREVLEHAKLAACENVRRFVETGRAENEVRREDYLT